MRRTSTQSVSAHSCVLCSMSVVSILHKYLAVSRAREFYPVCISIRGLTGRVLVGDDDWADFLFSYGL